MKKIVLIVLVSFGFTFGNQLLAQKYGTITMPEIVRNSFRTEISLPDIPGYVTLKCDFHIHTVFSDGVVWPTVRVDEAWEDGLDAIAITDHIENNPKKMPGMTHTEYEIALPVAKARDIILVRAGEISRSMPPGHFNALFVKDVNALNVPDYMDALAEAVKQGGFIIWNHPGWRAQQPDTTLWMKEHEAIYQKGWMHGIEVFNEKEWYPESLRWAMEKDLAVTGNSDIHEVYDVKYRSDLFPVRPMTLVFAKERTEESLREAMFAKRTATLFFNRLAGKKEFIEPLVNQSIVVNKPHLYQDGYIYFSIKNLSDIEFTFVKKMPDKSELPGRFVIPAQGTVILRAKQLSGKPESYPYLLENVLTGVEQQFEYLIPVE